MDKCKPITSKKVEKRARLENSVIEENLKTVFKKKIKKKDKLNKRIKSPHKISADRNKITSDNITTTTNTIEEKDRNSKNDKIDEGNSKSEVTEFLECNSNQIIGNLNLKPIMSFSQLEIDKEIKRVLKIFEKPTPIQATCCSGKTLAFTVPAVMHIKNIKNKPYSNQPIVLVISPTRELAMQIQKQCVLFDSTCGIKSSCVYGGVSKTEQYKPVFTLLWLFPEGYLIWLTKKFVILAKFHILSLMKLIVCLIKVLRMR
ncbi:hypothetical protein Glove_529g35 [Diversispora epigaea]|uniref:DEAD-box RNA helicase Q domain-containing protein n=1 Tax=Diversispora epigaea TaxID=1348612 RepID=A0A397GMF8_9GLOM|nr:hypothetical protein Glove_529g35 [Diversispora epigaea]